MKAWLVDTGPLVAYLNRKDPEHGRIAAVLDSFPGRLVSTGAVITEAMFFLAKSRGGPGVLADLVASGNIIVVDAFQAAELRTSARLMDRYSDTPMDFADATLVVVAQILGVIDILTLDRRGFSTFRTSEGRDFRLVLDA
jgi:predicted nucleic acid-binding protein